MINILYNIYKSLRKQQYIKEVCVGSLEEALLGQKNGGDRIELCSDLNNGGISPSKETIKLAKQTLNIPFTVMIRPRPGDFIYTKQEIDQMKDLILFCKNLQIFGVVFGILTPYKTVDIQLTKELVELSQPMETTFHRAFDEVEDYVQALHDVIKTGAKRILTSGTKRTAEEGEKQLNQLIKLAKNKIIIMPGSGINKQNLNKIIKKIKAKEYHGTKIV